MLRASVDIFFEIRTVPTLPVRMTCRTSEYFAHLHSNSSGRSIFLGGSEGRETVWRYFFISKPHVRVHYHLMKWHFFLRSSFFLHPEFQSVEFVDALSVGDEDRRRIEEDFWSLSLSRRMEDGGAVS